MKKILTDKIIVLTLASVLLSCSSSVLADDQVTCTGEVTVTAQGNTGITLTPLQTSGPLDDTVCLTADEQTITFSATELADDDLQNQVNSIGICKGTELQGYATISHSEVVNEYEVQLYLECQRDGITNSNRNEPGCWPEKEGCYYSDTQIDTIFMLTF